MVRQKAAMQKVGGEKGSQEGSKMKRKKRVVMVKTERDSRPS